MLDDFEPNIGKIGKLKTTHKISKFQFSEFSVIYFECLRVFQCLVQSHLP